MRLLTYMDNKFYQSDLSRENNFTYAFFTKRDNNNHSIEIKKT